MHFTKLRDRPLLVAPSPIAFLKQPPEIRRRRSLIAGRIMSLEAGLADGAAGWAIDLQNLLNRNNPNVGRGLQPYIDMRDALHKKYPGAYLSGDLAGMAGSGLMYGVPSAAEEAATGAVTRRAAAEAADTIAERQFGKQVFRGASVGERAAAEEAAAAEKAAARRALQEVGGPESPEKWALDKALADRLGNADDVAGLPRESYTNGGDMQLPGTEEPVTYRRVQGGLGTRASRQRIIVNDDGSISIPNKELNLNISVDNGEHSSYFRNSARGGDAPTVEFDVPKWFDDFLKENTIPQKNYNINPLNQSKTAPKLVDPTKPGKAFELPAPWIEWMEEYATNARIK